MFLLVLLPGSLPLMLTGLRLSANVAFHATIGVEMVGSRVGIGSSVSHIRNTGKIRLVYSSGIHAWASAAADWLETGKAAKTHAAACKTLKELLDEDVSRAFGHGIEAKRSKAGAITIREAK